MFIQPIILTGFSSVPVVAEMARQIEVRRLEPIDPLRRLDGYDGVSQKGEVFGVGRDLRPPADTVEISEEGASEAKRVEAMQQASRIDPTRVTERIDPTETRIELGPAGAVDRTESTKTLAGWPGGVVTDKVIQSYALASQDPLAAMPVEGAPIRPEQLMLRALGGRINMIG